MNPEARETGHGGRRIAFLSAEVAPFAKVGGLADVAGSLPVALQQGGAEPVVVMPRYGSIDTERYGLQRTGESVTVELDHRREEFHLLWGELHGTVPVLFLDNPRLFGGPDVYIDAMDRERFFFFSRAAPVALRIAGFEPEIIHCNDWHTGMAILWHQHVRRRDPRWAGQGNVLTIHNLAHQGITDVDYSRSLGYEPGHLLDVERDRYPNAINVLARAILACDVVTTVSPTYAREIQTEQFGAGLDRILRQRSDHLYGILNGIDPAQFDPADDSRIPCSFSAADPSGKADCKRRLQEAAHLDTDPRAPIIGVVSRLDDQKGFDLIAAALDRILAQGAQFVLLGTGDPRYHALFGAIADRYPGRAASFLKFDAALAQLIYAGSDLFLMPSRFEPCGLGQMIAMRYGSIPIVRATGGLVDTVSEWDAIRGTGTGFLFESYQPNELLRAVERGLAVYRSPGEWALLVRNALHFDASWARSGQEYMDVYDIALSSAALEAGKGVGAP